MWYKEGTISLVQGSAGITGVGTNFVSNTRVADMFVGPDGRIYEVVNAPNQTTLAIDPPYAGPSVSNTSTYYIVPIQGYVKLAVDKLHTITDGIESIDADVAASALNAAQAQASRLAAEIAEGNAETAAANAQASESGVAASAAAALASQQDAANSKTVATTKAGEAAASAADALASQQDAASSKSQAAASATTATTKAGEAAASATTASTKAGEAATSATNAASSATTATTKAGEASASATAATDSATTASTKAGEAATSATNAEGSATTASTKAGEAATSAAAAADSATTSTTKAGEASASATAAGDSATTATTKASEASSSATAAAGSATTASTKAGEAAASAADALASENAAATSETNSAASASAAQAAETAAAQSAVDAGTARDDAEAAAATLQGATVDKGYIDLSGGAYPAKPAFSSFWKVSVGGTVSGTVYGVGDLLIYTKLMDAFYRVANAAGGVTSVGGFTGDVTKAQLGIDQTYTSAEKAKLAGLESSHFKGAFVSLAALTAAISSPVAGDYGDVDAGTGADVERYVWDTNDTKWVKSGSGDPLTAAQVKTLYEANPDTNAFTDAQETKLAGIATAATANSTDAQLRDRSTHTGSQLASTISDFAATVRGTLLAGYAAGTNAVIAATDSILVAFGKLQRQVSDIVLSLANRPVRIWDFADQVTSKPDVNVPATWDWGPALQALFNHAEKRKIITPGTYISNQRLLIQTGTKLCMYGATLKAGDSLPTNHSLLQNTVTTGSTDVYYDQDIEIFGGIISGNALARTNSLVSFIKTFNVHLNNVRVTGNRYMGIALGGCRHTIFNGIEVDHCGNPTVTAEGGAAVWVGDNTGRSYDTQFLGAYIHDNEWSACYANGIDVLFDEACRLMSNRESVIFANSTCDGLDFRGIIDGTTKKNISASGIEFGGKNLRVSGQIRNTGNGCIDLTDARGVKIMGAKLSNGGQDLATFPNATYVTLLSTLASGSQVSKIQIVGCDFLPSGSGTLPYAYVGIYGTSTTGTNIEILDNDMTGGAPTSGKHIAYLGVQNGSLVTRARNMGTSDLTTAVGQFQMQLAAGTQTISVGFRPKSLTLFGSNPDTSRAAFCQTVITSAGTAMGTFFAADATGYRGSVVTVPFLLLTGGGTTLCQASSIAFTEDGFTLTIPSGNTSSPWISWIATP